MMIEVIVAPIFRRRLKQLRKKYRRIGQDVALLVEQLRHGETPGDQIPGVGYPVYKVRLGAVDQQRGKQGGYRVVYYIWTKDRRILLTIYTKADRENIDPDELRRIIEEFLRD